MLFEIGRLLVTAQLPFAGAFRAHKKRESGVLRAAKPLSTPHFSPFRGGGAAQAASLSRYDC